MARSRSKSSSLRIRIYFRRAVVVLVLLLLIALLTAMFYGIGQLFRDDDTSTPSPITPTTASQLSTPSSSTTSVPKPTVPKLDDQELSDRLTSQRIIAYNVTYETELFSRNADEVCDPASTTKLMTAILLSTYAHETHVFTVGDELDLLGHDSSVAGLEKGQQLSHAQMMDALMIPSGNDAAYVVAVNVGRILAKDPSLDYETAVSVFVTEMNRMATELGCQNTSFANPDGMTAEGHMTTARDMLKIARKANTFTAVKNSVSKTAVKTVISGESYYWKNTNEVLQQGPYHFTYITGMKTGFTTPAGYCLVASANRIGEEVIVVVLGGLSSNERFEDTYRLLDAAYAYHEQEENNDNF